VSNPWGELDHIIVFCDVGAPEADALAAGGFHEGPGNSHPGQGTVNRRFFFRNAYLELLWVENFAEAQSGEARQTGLWDRWRNRAGGACPFGLVFRHGPGALTQQFPTWTYAPRFFPPGFSIEVATGIPANEPLLFYLPFAQAALVETKPAAEGTRIGAINAVTIHLPETQSLSPALNSLVAAGVVNVEPSRHHLLDLVHVGGAAGIIDLRPVLPLRFLRATREQPMN